MGRGEWIDDLGLGEIKAAVIKQAYDDYVRARMRQIALEPRLTIGKNVADEIRRCNITASSIARNTSHHGELSVKVPAAKRPAAAKDLVLRNARRDVCEIESFFHSGKFELFADVIDGQALLDYAEIQLSRWEMDEIPRLECYARNEYKAVEAAKTKKKGRKGRSVN